jgi:hypothetical protein
VLKLPGDAEGAVLPWAEYGHDPRNTFNATTVRDLNLMTAPGGSATALVEGSSGLRVGPNPFNPRVTLAFGLRERGRVEVEVFDLAGRRLKTLLDGDLEPGAHQIVWDGRTDSGETVSSGVYFVRLARAGRIDVRKLLVVK